MPKEVEIKVREVHRYIVTKWEKPANSDAEACSVVIGEFPNPDNANEVAMAMLDRAAKEGASTLIWLHHPD